MLVNELACLHLAQQLIGIAADIARIDLISDDLPLRIDDEGSALCKTGRLDEHLEVARQGVRRIGYHRIRDLGDALRMIVPCLVDELRVARDGIDLTAEFLEGIVVILQILKLRRTDERKIGRIEEEYTPLAKKIVLRNGAEFMILVRFHRELADFFVDQ